MPPPNGRPPVFNGASSTKSANGRAAAAKTGSGNRNSDDGKARLPLNYQRDWKIVPIGIPPQHCQEKLGIVVGSGIFPGIQKEDGGESNGSGAGAESCAGNGGPAGLERQQTDVKTVPNPKPHCVIKRLVANSLGERYGMQAGDWFLQLNMLEGRHDADGGTGGGRPKKDVPSSNLLLANATQVQAWSNSVPYRKIYVLRERSTPLGSIADPGNTGTRQRPEPRPRQQKAAPPVPPATATAAATATAPVHDGSVGRKHPDLPAPTKAPGPRVLSAIHAKGLTLDSSDGAIRSDDVPFCLRCAFLRKGRTTRIPRLHHPWCPKNHCFDNSGADDIMERIANGRRIGCKACEQEYQTGKAVGDKRRHSTACLQHQRRMEAAQEERDRVEGRGTELQPRRRTREEKEEGGPRKNKRKSKSQSTGNRPPLGEGRTGKTSRNKTAKKGRQESERNERIWKHMEISSSSSASSPSEGEEELDDETSIYRPKNKKRTFRSLAANGSSKSTATMAIAKRANVSSAKKKGGAVPGEGNMPKRIVSHAPSVAPQHPKCNKNSESRGPPAGYQVSHSERIKPKWVPIFDDPWGEKGYLTGDVLLYGPKKGIGHYETHVSSCRYTMNPFENGSRYRTTHFTPEEGFSVILIKRDTLGKIPWGFRVTRDEFGKACIVKSVDTNSPASAALLLGIPQRDNGGVTSSTNGLDVNDMLLMINGRQIGGMKEIGFEMELDTSGSSLNLVVSRYKHRNHAAKKFAEMEEKMMRLMDTAARDSRLMGWLEVGNGMCAHTTGGNESSGARNRCQVGDSSDHLVQPLSESNMSVPSEANQSKNPSYMDQDLQTNILVEGNFQYDTENQKGKIEDAGKVKGGNDTKCLVLKAQENPGSQNRREGKKQSAESRRCEGIKNSAGDLDGIPGCGFSSMELDSSAVMNSRSGNSESNSLAADLKNDQNAWIGCVCGEIHSSQSSSSNEMFWIQCESCNAWYDVAARCIGFTEIQAKDISNWNCEACVPFADDNDSIGRYKTQVLAAGDARVGGNDCRLERENDELAGAPPCLRDLSPVVKAAQSLVDIRVSSGSRIKDDIAQSGEEMPNQPKVLAFRTFSPKQESPKQESMTRRTQDDDLMPRRQPATLDDGTFVQSPGQTPRGPTWSKQRGHWSPRGRKRLESRNGRALGESLKRVVADSIIPTKTKNVHEMKTHKSQPLANTRRSRTRLRSRQLEAIFPGDRSLAGYKYKIGDLVNVESHSWPGQNVTGGIGHIVDIRIDEDSDRLYSVKYVAARFTDSEILERFLELHSFD